MTLSFGAASDWLSGSKPRQNRFERFRLPSVYSMEGEAAPMFQSRKEELERRLEQSRRLLKDANDPTTRQRIGLLIGDLGQQQQQENEK
jgi:hypothetical protein